MFPTYREVRKADTKRLEGEGDRKMRNDKARCYRCQKYIKKKGCIHDYVKIDPKTYHCTSFLRIQNTLQKQP
jgi:hypothetical protein